RQQTRGLRDGRLHVDRRAVEAAVQIELERDLRRAERVHRRHRLESRDHRELVLERRRDRCAHRLGTRARQLRGDEQRREVDVRQVAHRQRSIGNESEQRDRRHQQAGRNRTFDEPFGDIHVTQLGNWVTYPITQLSNYPIPSAVTTCGIFRVLNIVAMYVYTTGVRYSVISCDTISPPTTARPSGRR